MSSYHGLEGKLLDLLDSTGSALLEGNAVETLVEVDGVLAGDNVGDGGAASLLSGGSHFKSFSIR